MKKYRNVYSRIIVIYIIINLVFLLCIQGMNRFAQEKLEEEYISSIKASFKFQGKNLERNLLYAKSIQDIITSDYRMKWLIYQAPMESPYNVYSVMTQIYDLLIALGGINPIIEDMGIYISTLNEILSCKKGWMKDVPPIKVRELDEGNFLVPDEKGIYMLSLPVPIRGEYNSLCYIKINSKEIKQIIKNIEDMAPGIEVGIFQDAIPLYTTELLDTQNIIGLLKDEKKLPEVQKIKNERKEYFLLSTDLVSSRIKIVMQLKTEGILQPITQFNNLFKVWILVSTVAFGIFIISTYYIVHRPLKELMRLMKSIETNNLDISIEYHTNDQFKYIFDGFNNMVNSLKAYIEKTYQQELEINKSELKQLQSQINPHFLYNCFFNISKLCKIEDSESAMILSQKLARYYMYITRNGSDYVTLEEEYEHTKVYLDIQAIRFGSRVKIKIQDIPEELKKIEVPRIILQPLVENCYKYVFEHIGEEGKINIEVSKEKNGLVISVEDNGSLIKDEEIEALNQKFIKDDKKSETTGLLNVNRRLKLKYSKESGLAARRGELGGLMIRVLITKEEI